VKGMKEESGGIKKLTSFERFICERENFVLDSLIYLEPVERFKNRSVMTLGVLVTARAAELIKNKLKTIRLCSRQIK